MLNCVCVNFCAVCVYVCVCVIVSEWDRESEFMLDMPVTLNDSNEAFDELQLNWSDIFGIESTELVQLMRRLRAALSITN